jgi:hypothetical protein
LCHEYFYSGYAGADARDEENYCRESCEKFRIQVNQQAETNQHKSRCKYPARYSAGRLRDYITVKLKRHLKTLSGNEKGGSFGPALNKLSVSTFRRLEA